MLTRFRQFIADIYDLKAKVEVVLPPQKPQIALMRALLGSIDPSIISGLPEKPEDRREFVQRVEHVYADLSKILTGMVNQQSFHMSHNDIDVSFARGTMNGIELLIEMLDGWHAEFIESKRPEAQPLSIGGIPSLNVSPFPRITAGEDERSS